MQGRVTRGISTMAIGALLAATIDAHAGTTLRLEGIGAVGVGETAYEISASDGSSSIRSRLEFPLDGTYVGFDACMETDLTLLQVDRLSLGFRFLTNMTDPDEDMNDYDWINGFLVGDTASEAEASSMILDFYAKGDVITQSNLTIRGILGARHEQYDFDVYGLVGYYLPPIGNGPAFLSSDTLALTYEMTHNWVYGGAEGELSIGDSLVAAGSAIAGIGFVEDRDDHVLRGKISEGEFISFSMAVAANLTWYLSPPDAARRFYLKGGIEAMSMVADGEQDQSFEDGSPGYSGIDDEIEMSLVTGNAMAGCEF
jgi:outer membrane protease